MSAPTYHDTMDLLHALLERLTWRVALYWLILIGASWLFLELADEIYEQEGFFFDKPILTLFYQHRAAWLDPLMLGASALGSVSAMAVICSGIALAVWWLSKAELTFYLFSMGGAVLLMVTTKYLLARERPDLFPDVNLWQEASPSFPSGHATGSMAFALTLFLIVQRHWPIGRWLSALLGSLFTLTISLSRLYLHVHYPSDILAGWALGIGWVLGVNYLFTRDKRVRNLVLTLPSELVEQTRQAAHDASTSVDAFVANALRKELEAQRIQTRVRRAGRP